MSPTSKRLTTKDIKFTSYKEMSVELDILSLYVIPSTVIVMLFNALVPITFFNPLVLNSANISS